MYNRAPSDPDNMVRIPVSLVVELALPVGDVSVPDFVSKKLCDEINKLITYDTQLIRTFSKEFSLPVITIELQHIDGYPIK